MSKDRITPQTLWETLGVTSGDTLWFMSIGIVLQAMVIHSILSKTIRYYERYQKRDSVWFAYVIGFGVVTAVATLFITCAQAYVVIYRDTLNVQRSVRYAILGDISHLLIGTFYHVATGICFAWRAYQMYGDNRWVLPPFVILLGAQFLVSVVTVAHGYRLPDLNAAGLSQLPQFLDKSAKLLQIWGWLTLAVDVAICLFMLYLIVICADSTFNRETKGYNKIVTLVNETMLLPVISLIAYAVPNQVDRNPQVDIRRIITCLLPVLYYHSLLHTLVNRQFVRKLVQIQIDGEGVNGLFNENMKLERKSQMINTPTSASSGDSPEADGNRGIYNGPFM